MTDIALSKRDLLLLAFLFLLESSIAVILKALQMKGDRSFDVFISTRPGLVFLCAAIAFFIVAGGIVNLYFANRRSRSRYFRLMVAMNLVMVLLILVTGEIVVRAGSRKYLDGEAFGKIVLVPKNWGMTRDHYRELIEKASGDLSYLVYHDRMGWSVGLSRRSANGLYRSNSIGARTPDEGVAFSLAEKKTHIALIGDSYTFGEEVQYKDTWGFHLGQLLGEKVQILNFGVPGYGVDQTYLRYQKDSKKWKPKVAIFGVFHHDLQRTMTVYPFLAHPHWDIPFSKPRFILSNGTVELLNTPPLPPEAIFSHQSIVELPLLKLDYGYKESIWQQRFYHASYLFRLFVSMFLSPGAEAPDFTDEALVSINSEIMKAFVRDAEREGTVPIAVYFPAAGELEGLHLHEAKRVLHDAGIRYADPTSCLLEVNSADRYMPGGHYAPAGNAAVAKCLLPFVQEVLREATVS